MDIDWYLEHIVLDLLLQIGRKRVCLEIHHDVLCS